MIIGSMVHLSSISVIWILSILMKIVPSCIRIGKVHASTELLVDDWDYYICVQVELSHLDCLRITSKPEGYFCKTTTPSTVGL
jgi:hypothetical protein